MDRNGENELDVVAWAKKEIEVSHTRRAQDFQGKKI